ncbi:MAG: metalloregulator ArsR/SmtB family transcription factor [Chloroflexota bacterium]|nr:metalloregulator ArsR/SmtB family transcription factor [Chloroflexota bacterium]
MNRSLNAGEDAHPEDVRPKKLLEVMTLREARLIARFFQALSDPTRVRMIRALADKEWCVSDLTEALGMDQPAVSHQLKYLREMGLVLWNKTGRHVYYRLADPQLIAVMMSSMAHLNEDTPVPTPSPREAKV